MKFFSYAAVASGLLGLASAFPAQFTLVADNGNNVVTDGRTSLSLSLSISPCSSLTNNELFVYIVQLFVLPTPAVPDNYKTLLLSGEEGQAVTYTAVGAPPTAWQALYVVDGTTSPVNLTLPHQVAPPIANTTDFTTDPEGRLAHDGEALFVTDPQGKVWWNGVHEAGYFDPVNLVVTAYSA